MVRRLFFFCATIAWLLTACTDNDSFSTDASHRLIFSRDTVRMDTLFSGVPSTTYSFWAYNRSGDGIRIRTVRLDRGNQSGFRVNVDGTFINPVGNDFEVRDGDSIRVFVEITSQENLQPEAQLVEDNLLFTLESGVVQRVNLRTYSWDAEKVTNKEVTTDETIESSMPLVVYGKGISVEKDATLTIRNTTLYFHDGAGIDVKGALVLENVLLRGDRLDHMFDYLPYDRVSGQWRGIRVYPKAEGITINDSEIHSAMTGLECDSTVVTIQSSIIHNCKGFGLYAHDSNVHLENSLFSNTLNDCVALYGCEAGINQCTMAQFYPFSANRGVALRFTITKKPMLLNVYNTLMTGYPEDVVMGEKGSKEDDPELNYYLENCLLRTPALQDTERIKDVIFEKSSDAVQGKAHFMLFDDYKFIYDFRVLETSPAYEKHIGWQNLPTETEQEQ